MKNKEKNKDSKTDIEKEKEMYTICLSIIIIGIISLLFLSSTTLIFQSSITGAVVLEPEIIDYEEEVIIDYDTISLDDISKELAQNAILQAERDMQEMIEAGFGANWVSDTLIEARRHFEGEDYTALLADIDQIRDEESREKARQLLIEAQRKIGVPIDYGLVLENTKSIHDRKIEAYEIKDLISIAEKTVNEFEKRDINATLAVEKLANAKTEFNEERFDTARIMLNEIEPLIEDIESENTLIKTNV